MSVWFGIPSEKMCLQRVGILDVGCEKEKMRLGFRKEKLYIMSGNTQSFWRERELCPHGLWVKPLVLSHIGKVVGFFFFFPPLHFCPNQTFEMS